MQNPGDNAFVAVGDLNSGSLRSIISNHSVGHQQAAFLLKSARDAFAKGHKGIERDSYHMKYMNKSTWAARNIT